MCCSTAPVVVPPARTHIFTFEYASRAHGGCISDIQFQLGGDAMAYTLPNLPYAANALEPHIDAMTMEIHHGRHHKAYVDNLNKALEGQANLQNKSIQQLLKEINQVADNIRTAIRNNGGGHANHSMFWEIMAKGGGEPTGPPG